MTSLPELVALIDSAMVDEPPINLKDGGVIRPGPRVLDSRAAVRRQLQPEVEPQPSQT